MYLLESMVRLRNNHEIVFTTNYPSRFTRTKFVDKTFHSQTIRQQAMIVSCLSIISNNALTTNRFVCIAYAINDENLVKEKFELTACGSCTLQDLTDTFEYMPIQ